MTNSRHLLFAALALCLAAIAGLGYTSWNLHKKVEALQSTQVYEARGADNQSVAPLVVPNVDAHWNRLWNGFDPMLGDVSIFNQQMDRLFDRMTGQAWTSSSRNAAAAPAIKFEEDTKEYRVTIESPEGMDVELNTELNENMLSVSGNLERVEAQGDTGSSRFSSSFSRSILLAEPVDQSAMEVINDEDKITVRVPKRMS